MSRKRVLWVGDAGCPTGFERVTRGCCGVLQETCDVTVLGMNYRGDPCYASGPGRGGENPYNYEFPVYAAAAEGAAFGENRLVWLMDTVKPDVVVILQDPWNIPGYLRHVRRVAEYKKIPIIGYIAVDGKNVQGGDLNELALAIFWTEFGHQEAVSGGYKGDSAVIPLGVDLDIFKPGDRHEARKTVGWPARLRDAFVVTNVNRNQPRKRLDLTITYFAQWVRDYKIEDAYLWLHIAPTGELGIDCVQLVKYYGLEHRVSIMQPPAFYGLSDQHMADTYRLSNVILTTTQGEGFGLTTLEAMACERPVIAPRWSALEEMCTQGVMLIDCSSIALTPGGINVIGGIADREDTINALHTLYSDPGLCLTLGQAGRRVAEQPRYRWRQVGESVRDAVNSVLAGETVAV